MSSRCLDSRRGTKTWTTRSRRCEYWDIRTASPNDTRVTSFDAYIAECRWMRTYTGRRQRPWSRLERENMVHEGTGLWHAAGFNASKWLMIIIHGYRVTTLVLYILLNVLVRTGEYNHLPVSPSAGCFSAGCLRTLRPSSKPSGFRRYVKWRQLRALFVLTSFCFIHLTFAYSLESLFCKYHASFSVNIGL